MNFIICKRRLCHTIAGILRDDNVGKQLTVKGWVKHFRDHKAVQFLKIADGLSAHDLQIVLNENQKSENLRVGCAIEAEGTLILSPARGQKYEFVPTNFNIVGGFPDTDYLFPLGGKATSDVNLSRRYVSSKNFIQIDTPLLTTSDCEGAGASFYVQPSNKSIYAQIKVENNNETTSDSDDEVEEEGAEKHFFGRPTFLTVSAQLQLEACACALKRVYTFNPAFRAEINATRQHLAEFYMLEAELAFLNNLDPLMNLVENLFRETLDQLLKKNEEDLKICLAYHKKWTKESLLTLLSNEPFQRITYSDALKLIQKQDKIKFTKDVQFGEDFWKEHEDFLVRHFGNVPIFVTHYPAEIKPFYMKRDENNMAICFDLLTPYAGEVCGGSLREDDYDVLAKRVESMKLTNRLNWYCNLRKLGFPKLGGFGIGFERYLQCILGAHNIKDCLPFPRWYRHCAL